MIFNTTVVILGGLALLMAAMAFRALCVPECPCDGSSVAESSSPIPPELMPDYYTYIDSKGREWALHSKNGMRFFRPIDEVVDDEAIFLPEGFHVVEAKTGLPVLKKNK